MSIRDSETTHKDRSDSELVELAQLGDDTAFEELFERYYQMVFRVAYQYIGTASDAEDILQETFVRAARAIDSFRKESKFSSWLYRITFNCAADLRKRREKILSTREALTRKQMLDAQAHAGSNESIVNALQQLPEKERKSIILAYYHGLNHAEIAGILGCAEKTISWYLNKGREKLRKILTEEASDEGVRA